MIRRLLLALAAVLALAGCAAVPTSPPSTGAATATVPTPAAVGVAAPPVPTAVTIPAIGVESPPLVELGLDAAGALQVPPLDTPDVAGWYGVTPGQVGPSVIAAHVSGRVDGASVPGLFARLDELVVGDEVLTGQADGGTLTWRVVGSDTYPKTEFPTAVVYGDENRPVLHLITCDGRLVNGSYLDNTIVFAELVGRS